MCNRKACIEPMALNCGNGLRYHDICHLSSSAVLNGRRIFVPVRDATVVTGRWPFSDFRIPADQDKQALGLGWVCEALPRHGRDTA